MQKKMNTGVMIIFLLIMISLFILYKLHTNNVDSSKIELSQDQNRLIEIIELYSQSKSNVKNEENYRAKLNNFNDIMFVGTSVFSTIEDGNAPDLNLLNILYDSFLKSNNVDVRKFSEEKLKDLIVQISYSSNYQKKELEEYVIQIKRIANANNKYLINEILKNNKNSKVLIFLSQEAI